jgi:NMD protein affecting ribosome stability and mRNA decay
LLVEDDMKRQRSKVHSGAGTPGPGRRVYEEAPGKFPEPAGCPRCGASYRDGRWTWRAATADASEHVCPACQRIEDDYPAGVLHVAGEFAAQHREDLVHLVRNLEERERAEHPLKRIMAITDEASGFAVTTTDAKLVETFGRALKKAYDGRLDHPPTTSDRQNLVRVRWVRD